MNNKVKRRTTQLTEFGWKEDDIRREKDIWGEALKSTLLTGYMTISWQ
jgi:hypothetical protein